MFFFGVKAFIGATFGFNYTSLTTLVSVFAGGQSSVPTAISITIFCAWRG